MSIRARTLAACTAMAMLLSGCILFPPFWLPTDPGAPGTEIVVENQTDEDWVLSFDGDIPTAFAIGAGETGTVMPYGLVPTEVVLLDPECAEVDRMEWDATASGFRISDSGTLSRTDAVPGDETTTFVEYWDCVDDGFGAAPEPGTALPTVGGTILLGSADGSTYTLEVASATVARLGEEPPTDVFDGEHMWSPDGTQVAFSRSGGFGDGPTIFVAAADGSDPEALVEMATTPRWSPDGTRIAYLNVDPFAGSNTVDVVELATGEIRQLAEEGSTASWSPDGEQIAFIASSGLDGMREPISELRVVNADGSGLRTLADASLFAAPPSWSPDGSRLAFAGQPEGAVPGAMEMESVISVYDLGSDEETVLAAIGGMSLGEPVWAPDGETIAFTTASFGLFGTSAGLATVAATGGEVSRLSEASGAYYYMTPLWSPDGSWLAVTRSDDTNVTGVVVALQPDGAGETVLATGVLALIEWR